MSCKTRKIAPDFGLEISGIDLASEISDDCFAEIIDHYYHYSMLLFRDQDLPPQRQAALTHRFGKPKIETRKQFNFVDYPEVSTIGNIRNRQGQPLSFFARGGFGWHTDGIATCHVNAATFLYAVEVPRDGGDTLFLSTAAAYRNAPSRLIEALENVSFLSSFHAHNDALLESDPDSFIPLTPQERDALPPVWHDVIQTHPLTGKKVFYLYQEPLAFKGVSDENGKQLLDEVVALASTAEHVYRHRWKPGELIIWDNHAMLHSGTETRMYESDRRLMHRSFVYTMPTARPLPNYHEVSRIFMPDEGSIRLSDFANP